MTDSTFDLLELPLSPAHLEVLARAGAVVQERHRTGVRYPPGARDDARQNVWRRQPEEFFDEAVIDMDGTLVVTTGEPGWHLRYPGRLQNG